MPRVDTCLRAEYHVFRCGKSIGRIERAYHGAISRPGLCGYQPGRYMYRFLDNRDALGEVEDQLRGMYPQHGRYYDTLRDAKDDLPEGCMFKKMKFE